MKGLWANTREALKREGGGALSAEEAAAFVERYLTQRSAGGFASGGMGATFILRELDDAVADLVGERLPAAQTMTAEEWSSYRKTVAGSDDDDEKPVRALIHSPSHSTAETIAS